MRRGLVTALFAFATLIATAQDGWTVIILCDDGTSEGRAISGDEQFGVFSVAACGWAGSEASFTSYAPSVLSSTAINGAFGLVKGGSFRMSGSGSGSEPNAAVWTGGPADFQILEPFVNIASSINSVSADGPVGFIEVNAPLGATSHARLWQNLTNAIDLHPTGAAMSIGRGASAGIQVGEFRPLAANTTLRACLWRGSAETFLDLSPTATDASAMAADGNIQAGFIDGHAGIWRGTPESFVDLQPTGASESACFGARSVYQVGKAVFKGLSHAGIWSGSKASFIDLHQALPKGYAQSQANAVSTKLTQTSPGRYSYRIDVVGWAEPTNPKNVRHAILWRLEGALTSKTGTKLPPRVTRRIRAGRLDNRKFVIDFSQPIREPIPRWQEKFRR